MYKKILITTAVALSLTACGGEDGGGGSGGAVPPAPKKITLNFFDLKKDNTTNCQAYAVDLDNKITVSAASVKPKKGYHVVLHDKQGKWLETKSDLSSSLQLDLTAEQEQGYLSLVKVSDSSTKHITTIKTSLIPNQSSLSFYTERQSESAFNCVLGNNPNIIKYSNAYIDRPADGNHFFGFNTYLQNLEDVISQYKPLSENLNFSNYNNKSALAVRYTRNNNNTNTPDDDKLEVLNGFKFISDYSPSGLGTAENKLQLNEITEFGDWSTTDLTNAKLTEAHLFIDGKKYNAPNAYLWQPDLAIASNSDIIGAYAYNIQIEDDNYYLYLKGEQTTPQTSNVWQFQHVENPNTVQTGLNTDLLNYQLVKFGDAQLPKINTCSSETGQCIKTYEIPNWQGVQRLYVSAGVKNSKQVVRQVIYTTPQQETPVMAFPKELLPQEEWEKEITKLSYFKSNSQEAITAFLYQHQNVSDQLNGIDVFDNTDIDYLPLLMPVSTQLEQQDLLRRQSYTWVWTK